MCRARRVYGVCGCGHPRSVVSTRGAGWGGSSCRFQASSDHTGLGIPDVRYLRDSLAKLEPGDADRHGYEAWASRWRFCDAYGRGLVLSGENLGDPTICFKDWPVASLRPAPNGERSAPQDLVLNVPTSWGGPPAASRSAVRQSDRHVGMRRRVAFEDPPSVARNVAGRRQPRGHCPHCS